MSDTSSSDRAGLIAPSSCPESDAAIWGRAGALVDTTGDLFVATGNGHWDGRTHWGDATLELTSDATHLDGNYTPANTATLDATDADLGSTSSALLGSGLVVQGARTADAPARLIAARGDRAAPRRR